MVDMTAFSPASALMGGALIGAATALLLIGSGHIAGISGILGGLLRRHPSDRGWRIAFLLGLLLTPILVALSGHLPTIQIDAAWVTILLAGLLVGFGSRLGSGCTSGHGICGLARLSPRSLLATLCFMGSGFVTVFVLRHLVGV